MKNNKLTDFWFSYAAAAAGSISLHFGYFFLSLLVKLLQTADWVSAFIYDIQNVMKVLFVVVIWTVQSPWAYFK